MAELWDVVPEWSVPLLIGGLGFLGALLGSVIGFVAMQRSTSRQITSSERATRLDVYSSFLARADELSAAISELATVREGVIKQPLASAAETLDMGALVARVRAEADQGSAGIVAAVERVGNAFEALVAEQTRVALVAPEVVRKAAQEVVEAGNQVFKEQMLVEPTEPATSFGSVVGDFTAHARTDIQAPGSIRSHRTTRRRQRSLDADETGG